MIILNNIITFLSIMIFQTSSAAINIEDQSIYDRIKPIGRVKIQNEKENPLEIKEKNASKTPEGIYKTFCISCHGSGIAGAPKFADASSWGDRKNKGIKILTNNAIKGYNAMPAKGTCQDCSDDEIKQTVQYMLKSIK